MYATILALLQAFHTSRYGLTRYHSRIRLPINRAIDAYDELEGKTDTYQKQTMPILFSARQDGILA